MNDRIYLVDSVTKMPMPVDRAPFSDMGIRERSDLQEWILAYPQMLGEDLLVITSDMPLFVPT